MIDWGILFKQFPQFVRHRCKGVFVISESVRTSQVTHEHDRLCPLFQDILDSRQSSNNPAIKVYRCKVVLRAIPISHETRCNATAVEQGQQLFVLQYYL